MIMLSTPRDIWKKNEILIEYLKYMNVCILLHNKQ